MVTTGTKYTRKRGKDRSYDLQNSKIIIGNDTDDTIKEIICPNQNCGFILHTRSTEGEHCCPRCHIPFEIQNTRKRSKLETPHRNSETLVANPRYVASGNTLADKVKIHHEPDLQGGFLALSKKGLKVTNYREDVG